MNAVAYTILQRVHRNQYDAATDTVIPGWALTVRWGATGTVIPVFVPDADYTPPGVDTAIRQAGTLDDQIERLGGAAAPPAAAPPPTAAA